MTELSPAAQSVLDAYGEQVGGSAAITSYERRGIAAALRAAADRISSEADPGDGLWGSAFYEGVQETCLQFLAIAAELEGAG